MQQEIPKINLYFLAFSLCLPLFFKGKKALTHNNLLCIYFLCFPAMDVTPAIVFEGDHLSIKCIRSPYETPNVWFAFYKNNYPVEVISVYDEYTVDSARLENSGYYYCEFHHFMFSSLTIASVTRHIQVHGKWVQMPYQTHFSFLTSL